MCKISFHVRLDQTRQTYDNGIKLGKIDYVNNIDQWMEEGLMIQFYASQRSKPHMYEAVRGTPKKNSFGTTIHQDFIDR